MSFEETVVTSAAQCLQKCGDESECTAYVYTEHNPNSCVLYRGGPYVRGDDRETCCMCYVKGNPLSHHLVIC